MRYRPAAALLALFVSVVLNAAPHRRTAPVEGYVTTADGARLYFRKFGHGPLAVIAPSDMFVFDLLRQVADTATVVTYDTRFRGRSEAAPNVRKATLQQDVDDLETVRTHFGFRKFVPVGFSYLGKAVVLYARQHPDRIARLVQIGAVSMTPEPAGEPVDAEQLGAPAADVARMRQLRQTDAKQQTPREYCAAEWAVTRFMLVGRPENARKVDIATICSYANEWPVNAEANLGTLWDSVDETKLTADDLRNVTAPVLTIHGTNDRNASYSGGRAWAAALPNARLLTLTGAGHMAWIDDEKTVLDALRTFLRGRWPAAAQNIAAH